MTTKKQDDVSDVREALQRKALQKAIERTAKAAAQKKIESGGEPDRRCLTCGVVMELHACHGVVVNICRVHGVWLDKGELEKILAAERARTRRIVQRSARSADRTRDLDAVFTSLTALFLE